MGARGLAAPHCREIRAACRQLLPSHSITHITAVDNFKIIQCYILILHKSFKEIYFITCYFKCMYHNTNVKCLDIDVKDKAAPRSRFIHPSCKQGLKVFAAVQVTNNFGPCNKLFLLYKVACL